MGGLSSFLDIPIVGDIAGGLIGHGSQSELQEDSQAFSAQQFERQKQHEKDMFGLESDFAYHAFTRERDFNSAMAKQAYDRQRQLLKDSPTLQMQGLKSAGLNPILAATGGFKSPAGGSMPIASAKANLARASSGGSGSASPLGAGTKVQLGQARLLNEQANLTSAQKAKVQKETDFVGTKLDIAEPVAKLMQAVAGMLEQSNIDRKTTQRVWEWLTEEIPDVTKPMSPQEQAEMLEKAKRRFPQLKGVDNAKRKIFGGQ